MPSNATLGCIIREVNGQLDVFMSSNDFVIQDGDQVIVFVADKRQIPEVERLFAPSVGFF